MLRGYWWGAAQERQRPLNVIDSWLMARPWRDSSCARVALVERVVDVFDGAAGGAAEVGVVAGGRLVHRRTFTRDVEFEDMPEFLEPGQTAMNRRKPDARLPLAGPHENVLRRRVTTRPELVDDVEDHAIVGREFGG